jgi:hypothetical protein
MVATGRVFCQRQFRPAAKSGPLDTAYFGRVSYLPLSSNCMPGSLSGWLFAPARRLAWRWEIEKLRRACAMLPSDFERTKYLREYVGALIPIGRPDDRTRHIYAALNFASFNPADFYPLFRNYSLSAQCGITTFFYIKLLQALGFKAYQYSFGFTAVPYERFVHSVALVQIAFNGGKRLIVQDPYFNLTYRARDGAPCDFFEFLAAVRRRRYHDLVMDSPSVSTFLLVPDTSLYFPYLTEECRILMASALARDDGTFATRMPIARSYASLMQSPCGGGEDGFLKALREHGFDEPFVYAYTLRASDLVGDLDHAQVQRRIDAVLLPSRDAVNSPR